MTRRTSESLAARSLLIAALVAPLAAQTAGAPNVAQQSATSVRRFAVRQAPAYSSPPPLNALQAFLVSPAAASEAPQIPTAPAPACASTEATQPNGLVVVLPPGQPMSDLDRHAVSNPVMNGVAMQVDWRDLEPTEGKPDWSRLDELFTAAQSAGKWVHLLIFPGFFSPDWALKGVETESFPIQYGPGRGNEGRLPMPWDRVYLDRWFAFVKQVSDRYGKSPAFRLIAADGPTSVSAEMTLPVSVGDVAKWRAHGYTPTRYLDAWNEVFQTFAKDFPQQCISLSGPGLPILEQGRGRGGTEADAHVRAIQSVIEQAQGVIGRRLAIQWSDLHAGRAAVEAPDRTSLLISYNGRLITGLQMRSAAENGGATVMGAAGDPPLALRRSVDKGLEPNAAGRRISYLEVYRPDVLAEEMQPVLRYAASLFSQK